MGYSCKDLLQYLSVVNRGRKIWNVYKNKYNIRKENLYLVLLPTDNNELNLIFFKYIEKCFEPHKKIIILAYDSKIKKISFLFEKRNEIVVETVSKKLCEELIFYYTFIPFYNRFYLISLTEPNERKCDYLIGKKGITAEELIAVGIMGYDIGKYHKMKKYIQNPSYEGNDEDIISFLH